MSIISSAKTEYQFILNTFRIDNMKKYCICICTPIFYLSCLYKTDLFMIQTFQNVKSSMSLAIALSFADSAFLTEIRSKRRKHEANSLEATVCANNENSMQKFSRMLLSCSFFPRNLRISLLY